MGIFPAENFATENWKSIQELADDFIGSFPKMVGLAGTPPDFICPSSGNGFIRDFYDVYHGHWSDKFGLSLYEQEGLYAEVKV